jgi:hypothetical protein
MKIFLILLFLTGFIAGAVIEHTHVWRQIESQALQFDLAEGAQL